MSVIERGIPIPSKETGRKYPLDQLEVGDSLFVAVTDGNVRRLTMVLAACMKAQTRRTGKRFTQRKTTEPLGVRVWRVA